MDTEPLRLPFPYILLKTDPSKRKELYKSLSLVKGVADEPIALDFPGYHFDTACRILWIDDDKSILSKVMQIDGVIDGVAKILSCRNSFEGTGKFPENPATSSSSLDMSLLETEKELEEWAKKQDEKEKKYR